MGSRIAAWVAVGCGAFLVVLGGASIYIGQPHPELCTLGAGMITASTLISSRSNGGR